MENNKDYNWWTDPKNEEEVKRLSWWDDPKNKETFNLPISVVNSDGHWVATCNDETKKILGEGFNQCAQGKTKEEAINKMFMFIRMGDDYLEECRLNYQRWVPFRKGEWKQIGGKWIIIFGIHIYFRYGKGMKGGTYLPFTKLNICFSNEWTTYRKFKNEKKKIRKRI